MAQEQRPQGPHDNDGTWVSEQVLLADTGVAPTKLKHWYKTDCLPHPVQRHMPGQAGSRSFYPPHAPAQLQALLRLYEKETRYTHLRFQLWLEGYDISEQALRHSLRVLVLESFTRIRSLLRGRPRDSLAAAEQIVDHAAHRAGRSPLSRLLRQQVPNAADRRSVLVTIMQLFFGGRPAFGISSPTEKSLAQLLVQALGLEAAQTDHVGEVPPWLPKDITCDWEEMAGRKLLSMSRLARAVLKATREELEQARQDRVAFCQTLLRMVQIMESVYGSNPLGMGMVLALRSDELSSQAAQIVMMLVVRNAGDGHALDVLSATFREQLEKCEPAMALCSQVHAEIPELADAVRSMIQDLRRGEKQEVVIARLEALMPKFAPQLRAFWERHPDLAAQWGVAA